MPEETQYHWSGPFTRLGWLEEERREGLSAGSDLERLVGWLKLVCSGEGLVWLVSWWDLSGVGTREVRVSMDWMEDLHMGQTSSWTEQWSQKPLQGVSEREGLYDCVGLLVITRDQLNVGEIIKAESAGVLLHAQPLHGLQLEWPRQDFLLFL